MRGGGELAGFKPGDGARDGSNGAGTVPSQGLAADLDGLSPTLRGEVGKRFEHQHADRANGVVEVEKPLLVGERCGLGCGRMSTG